MRDSSARSRTLAHQLLLLSISPHQYRPSKDNQADVDTIDDHVGDEPVSVSRRIFGLEYLRRCHITRSPPCSKIRSHMRLVSADLKDLPTNVIVRQVDFLVCPAMFREISEITMLPCARKNCVQ